VKIDIKINWLKKKNLKSKIGKIKSISYCTTNNEYETRISITTANEIPLNSIERIHISADNFGNQHL